MPLRFSALAGGLLVSLPLVLSTSSAQEQLPWQRGADPGYQQPDNGYRAGDAPRRYEGPGADDPGTNSPPRRDTYSGNRNDAYSPRYASPRSDDAYRPPSQGEYSPRQPNDAYQPPRRDSYSEPSSSQGRPYGQPYSAPPPESYDNPRERRYGANDYGRRGEPYDRDPREGGYSSREILDTGHGFFGSVSKGLASVVEYTFRKQGRPNGYILGQQASGAFVAGLRYGEGTLYTKDAGTHKIYWQGPSIGYDAGAEGSKVMMLVYNLHYPEEVYQRFAGVDGSAYFVGGVGVTFLGSNDMIVAPIRSGVGLRLGANIGYLKYTRTPTWNPF